MTEKPSRNIATTSAVHTLGEASYLDARFLAYQTEYEAILRWVGVENSWRVLDAGCGSGSFLPLMSQLVGSSGKIDAIDLAPENVAFVQAQQEHNAFASPVTAQVGSIVNLPYENDTFDAVWCAAITQYLTDDAKFNVVRISASFKAWWINGFERLFCNVLAISTSRPFIIASIMAG